MWAKFIKQYQRCREYRRKIWKAEERLDSLREFEETEGAFDLSTEEYCKEEIAFWKTQRLIEKCERYMVAVPSDDREGEGIYWRRSEFFPRPGSLQGIFTETAFEELTAKISMRRKERIGVVVSVTTAVVGILGALTGLVAVWKD